MRLRKVVSINDHFELYLNRNHGRSTMSVLAQCKCECGVGGLTQYLPKNTRLEYLGLLTTVVFYKKVNINDPIIGNFDKWTSSFNCSKDPGYGLISYGIDN